MIKHYVSIALCFQLILIVIPANMVTEAEEVRFRPVTIESHMHSFSPNFLYLLLSFQFQQINQRWFLWQYPDQMTSSTEYPIIFLLHGAAQYPFSWFFGLNRWGREQCSFTLAALERGYLIVAPASSRPVTPGPRAWDIFEEDSRQSEDIQFIVDILDWFTRENISINLNKVFCAGFSSGAFMTSRLALDVPDIFTAMAVHSGSNAEAITLTDRGPIFDCTSPHTIPPNHPPTLIIHGSLDSLVPPEFGIHYHQELQRHDIKTALLLDENTGHIWISNFNDDILHWFSLFRDEC